MIKVIIAAALALCAAIFYFAKSHNETSQSSESGVSAAASASSSSSSSSDAVAPSKDQRHRGPQESAARHSASVVQAKMVEATVEQRQTLAEYSKIRHKVFLSESDKKERSKLLRDRAFLTALAPIVLASTASDNQGGDVQNDALDLLYDALNAESKDAAIEVLGQVVHDDQVENKDLPLKDRENLAGVKAEVLYEWVSRDASAVGKISTLLPGKVSQQLWQNVQARQSRNMASSAIEAAKSK